MLENTSSILKTKILTRFVRELILNSKNAEIFRLEEILVENGKPLEQRIVILSKEDIKEKIKKEVKLKLKKPHEEFFDKNIFEMEESKPIKKIFQSIIPYERRLEKTRQQPQRRRRIPQRILSPPKRSLRIPEIQLPERLRDLMPVASQKTIELGKLDSLIQDPKVKTIETTGEGQKIIVTGQMGKKPTNIILSKEEISEIINRFSIEAKIPQHEGLFKAVVGNLILTGIISESISSRFLIKKIPKNLPHPRTMSAPRPN